eukprot:Rmarinus@m.24807
MGRKSEVDLVPRDSWNTAPDDFVDTQGRRTLRNTSGGQGVEVCLRDLCYTVEVDGEHRQLLKDVTLFVRPNEMCAIMGASGAGKSTLLDILADRKNVGILQGDLLFNGVPRGADNYPLNAYVQQDDILLPELTVRETLHYAARFRMPASSSDQKKVDRVNLLIDYLGLGKCADTRVGSIEMKGISGGERKRLSIGVEIINLPDLMFLDEPTSGLDASIALEVISSVRSITNENRTTFITIHQPSAELFQLFDKVVLLNKGETVYFGPASSIVDYFTSAPLNYELARFENPADFIIKVSVGKLMPKGDRSARQQQDLVNLFKASKRFKHISGECDRIANDDENPFGRITPVPENPVSQKVQAQTLAHRTRVCLIREQLTQLQLKKALISALFLGTVYFNVDDDRNGAFDRFAFFFFSVNLNMMSFFQAVPQFHNSKALYQREKAARCYSTWTYMLVFVLLNSVLITVSAFIFTVVSYWLVGLVDKFESFFYFFVVQALTQLIGLGITQLLAINTRNVQKSLAIIPLFLLSNVCFSGFLIRVDDMPTAYQGIGYIYFTHYALKGLTANEFNEYDDDECWEDSNGDCYTTSEIEDELDADDWNRWISAVVLACWASAMFLLCYWCLLRQDADTNLVVEESKKKKVDLGNIFKMTRKTFGADESDSSANNSLLADASESTSLLGSFSKRKTYSGAPQWPAVHGEGCVVAMKNISLTVEIPVERGKEPEPPKRILNGINALVRPKEMCAIMGASGAGKTTLLHLLAGREISGSHMEGQLLFSGHSWVPGVEGHADGPTTGYVLQDDLHIAVLTVQETLEYAARFRMKHDATVAEIDSRVDLLMDTLNLKHTADTIVGDVFRRGISGGERKRLSVGVELVNLPELMFLDEPTSGLDASIALEVMRSVRRITDRNRTTFCTVHQPSSEIFFLFDKLLLLAQGHVVYFGPVSSCVEYFTSKSLNCEIGKFENPADFVIKIAGSHVANRKGEVMSREQLVAIWQQDPQCHETNNELMEISDDGTPYNPDYLDVQQARFRFFTQFWTLLVRSAVVFRRDQIGRMLVIRNVLSGLLFGTLFYDLSDTTSGAQDRFALLFQTCCVHTTMMMQAMTDILQQRVLFQRERAAGAYTTLSFSLVSLLIWLPAIVLQCVIFSSIMYYMVGFKDDSGAFVYFIVALVLLEVCGLSTFQLIAAAVKNPSQAAGIVSLPLILSMYFMGYSPKVDDVPAMWTWAPWSMYSRYCFEGLSVNEFEDSGDWEKTTGSGDTYKSGEALLEDYGFEDWEKLDSIVILFMFFAVQQAIVYSLLRWRN